MAQEFNAVETTGVILISGVAIGAASCALGMLIFSPRPLTPIEIAYVAISVTGAIFTTYLGDQILRDQ